MFLLLVQDSAEEEKVYQPNLTKAAIRAFWSEIILDLGPSCFLKEVFRVTAPLCLGYYMLYFKEKYGK